MSCKLVDYVRDKYNIESISQGKKRSLVCPQVWVLVLQQTRQCPQGWFHATALCLAFEI